MTKNITAINHAIQHTSTTPLTVFHNNVRPLGSHLYLVQFELESQQFSQHGRECRQHYNFRDVVQQWVCRQARHTEWTFQLLPHQHTHSHVHLHFVTNLNFKVTHFSSNHRLVMHIRQTVKVSLLGSLAVCLKCKGRDRLVDNFVHCNVMYIAMFTRNLNFATPQR